MRGYNSDHGSEIPEDDPRYLPDDMVASLKTERSLLDPDMSEAEQSRHIFNEHAPAAAATIAHIAIHGTSERVRLDASKYVVERVLGRVGDDVGTTDPLKDFMNSFFQKAEAHANANTGAANNADNTRTDATRTDNTDTSYGE